MCYHICGIFAIVAPTQRTRHVSIFRSITCSRHAIDKLREAGHRCARCHNRGAKQRGQQRAFTTRAKVRAIINNHHRSELIQRSWRSGLAVLGASLSYFVTVGFLNAAGVFVEYYTSTLLRGTSNFQVSWLSSFGLFCFFIAAPPAGLLTDKYGPTVSLSVTPRRHRLRD